LSAAHEGRDRQEQRGRQHQQQAGGQRVDAELRHGTTL
jgi:hypothetical protein